jgi:hypothetical protein
MQNILDKRQLGYDCEFSLRSVRIANLHVLRGHSRIHDRNGTVYDCLRKADYRGV